MEIITEELREIDANTETLIMSEIKGSASRGSRR